MTELEYKSKVYAIVNSVFKSKTYILYNDICKDCYLIDCGDADEIIDYARKNALQLKGIFLTHSHFDHIYGLNDVLEAYPECEVYTSEYGAEALTDDRKNFSHYHEAPIGYKGPAARVLKEGDSVELFSGCELQVMETPGHCPSCLTYVVGEYIFTGDSYIPGVKVVTNLPKGNKATAEESLQRILTMAENRIVCAGHDVNSE